MLPRINEAFAKPLYLLDAIAMHDQILSQTQGQADSPPPRSQSDLSTDTSVMDVSSIDDSSTSDELISVDSYPSDN